MSPGLLIGFTNEVTIGFRNRIIKYPIIRYPMIFEY